MEKTTHPDRTGHDFESAKAVAEILNRHGHDAYIIGGAVRDLWLGHTPKDFDLVTSATPAQIMAIPEFSRSKHPDTAQAFGVTRVKFNHRTVDDDLEIATFRIDVAAHRGRKATQVVFAELEDDVWRRDFTINALALCPATNQIIDFVEGIDDLQNKIVRFIGRPAERIHEDPLRLMRAIRFKNQLNFSYHPRTARAIASAVRRGAVATIAVDRLRDELTNLLLHPSRRQAITDLDDFGILELVLPEVTAGKTTAQPPQFHAEGNVWQHELLILDYLPVKPSQRLVWAALLHDIGKVPTARQTRSPKARIRFDRHYAVGAEMAKTVLRRLKFSNHDTRDICWMIYNHMAIDDLPAMRPSHRQRMLGHPAFADLLELHRADAAASRRPGQAADERPQFRVIERLWREYQAKPPKLQQPSLKRDLGIDGHWLLDELAGEIDASAGPLIGTILGELEEMYLDEGVTEVKDYRERAHKLLADYSRPAE